MKIRTITRETNISSNPYNIFVNYSEEELRIINDKIPIIPKISPNFKSYETSLNDIDQQINQIKDQHRIVSATEVAYSITKYAGYISLGILATYVLNKIGLLPLLGKILSNLNPFKTSNICIKIFCQENTQQNTPIQPQPLVHYTIAPTLPMLHEGALPTYLDESPTTTVNSRRKLVRFGGPNPI